MFVPPPVSEDFKDGVETLLDDMQAYYNFIENFGTHYVKRMTLGAKYGY